jgi:CRISPR-associated endonuclease/helicase Cas3
LGKRSRKKDGEKAVNFGILVMDRYLEDTPADGAFSPSTHAPPILPAYLEAWCQTTAIPETDPAVAPFLHGRDAMDVDEIQVVWRADLEDNWLNAVMVAPPSIREAMSIPIWALKNWLGSRSVLLWCGLDSKRTGLTSPKAIRPGDTVVLPSEYGGADEFGWHPESKKPVADIGDEVGNWVRLHPAFLGGDPARRLARILRSEELDIGAVAQLAKDLGLVDLKVATARRYGSGVILLRKPELMAEGDAGSVSSVPVLLTSHLEGVQKRARQFTLRCRLTPEETEAIVLAAQLHDIGKLDPRFQAILHGGDLIAAYQAIDRGEALGKSGTAWTLADYRKHRAAAGYPDGARHEAASVKAAEYRGASDIVLHLIAAHHGYARPSMGWWSEQAEFFIPIRVEGASFEVSPGSELGAIDSFVIDRFWSLCTSMGMWRLAFVEAVLRLADWAQSAEEANA